MNQLIDLNFVAQILAGLSFAAMVLSTHSSTSRKLYLIQASAALLSAISYALLGGWTGVVSNLVAVWRNVLASNKGNLGHKATILLGALQVGIGLTINTRGLIGLLPIIASVGFTISMNWSGENVRRSKMALILNQVLWAIYSFAIGAWVALISKFILIASTAWSLRSTSSAE